MSRDRLHEAVRRVEDAFADPEPDPDRLGTAVDGLLRLPGADDVVYVPEVLADLAETYSRAGRTEEAITSMERAIAAGYDPVPNPRMDIARFLVHGGRVEEARAIHAEIAEATPDDVWFYNAAGMDEAEAGDDERAVEWLGQGVEVAIETGDEERVLDQLLDLRERSLARLGREPDDVQRRGHEYLAELDAQRPRSPRADRAEGAVVPGEDRTEDVFVPAPATSAGRSPVPVEPVFGWFPPDEFAVALERWPELADRWATDDYTAYARTLQAHMLDFTQHGGKRPRLAPLHVDRLIDHAVRTGSDPAAPRTRAELAAQLGRSGEAMDWPPGRNDPCWCRSGTKYKRCCDRVPVRPDDRVSPELGGRPVPDHYELDISLVGATPPVWRRIQITSEATFLDLHHAIQDACGWTNSHLFAFHDLDGQPIAGLPDLGGFGPAVPDVAEVPIRRHFMTGADACSYLYDFGDSWEHDVVLRDELDHEERFTRRLVAGERAFPPEDCGGLPGYEHAVEVATGRAEDEHLEEWLGDWHPEVFDLEATRTRFDR